ncbi:hypothetical protein AXF42_Ash015074 [Apostasia shenzhenica]|uniref:Uncharacterized protein n=1 Tax=Apostasia shenzhenica TaxID=1088818 RepID=A0A2I0B320_9ASPA|nr:hypothetical protein AXF42_Ash015074 [Apostasia shenzhenica]
MAARAARSAAGWAFLRPGPAAKLVPRRGFAAGGGAFFFPFRFFESIPLSSTLTYRIDLVSTRFTRFWVLNRALLCCFDVNAFKSCKTMDREPEKIGGCDHYHHGPPRVNFWEDPLSPSKWKEEHIVLVSLAGWGLIIYGGYKLFGGKKEQMEEVILFHMHEKLYSVVPEF